VFVGLSWYYRDSWVLLAAQIAMVGSSLVPYIRARGEAAGVAIKDVGFMPRAERIVYLGVAVAMSPVVEVVVAPNDTHPLHRLAVVGLVLLAVSTQVTALQRFIHLLWTLDERSWDRAWLRAGRGSLWRGAIAAALATGIDYLVATSLVSTGRPALATFCGALVGAVINFTANRLWTFGSRGARLPQAGRYAFVSLTSALLNAGGVAVLLWLPHLGYSMSWALVHLAVFLAWNFPLHRGYVFKAREVPAAKAA
jgi:putative flippase GtrA